MVLTRSVNDISVIYVAAHRYAGGRKKKVDERAGAQRHKYFVRFLIGARPTRGHFVSWSSRDWTPL